MNNYMIVDACAGLLADNPCFVANNAKDAVKQYMKDNNIKGDIKRSGENTTRFKAIKYIEHDGRKYYSGRTVWFMHVA